MMRMWVIESLKLYRRVLPPRTPEIFFDSLVFAQNISGGLPRCHPSNLDFDVCLFKMFDLFHRRPIERALYDEPVGICGALVFVEGEFDVFCCVGEAKNVEDSFCCASCLNILRSVDTDERSTGDWS